MSGNPWLEAGRAAVASEAAEQIRAAGTDSQVDTVLRGALGSLLGRSVSVHLRGNGAGLVSVREAALGLLRAAVRSPEAFPNTVLAQRLPDDAYAVTRTTDGEPGILFVNSRWLSDRERPAFVSSLIADRAAHRPDNAAAMLENHVVTTRPGAGEHRSEPARGPREDPLWRHDAIGNARSVTDVAAHLRTALSDITDTPVEVDLGTDTTTDLWAAREIAQGVIWELLDARHEGLSAVEVGDLPAPYADAYAATFPREDGSYEIVFNGRWHQPRQRGQLDESLRADAAASPGAPGDPADLAGHQAVPPSHGQPRVAVSPRGEVTPYESIHRIGEAETIGDVQRELREGLGTALGHEVAVWFLRSTDVETAREVSEQLVRSALAAPDAQLRSVRVDALPRGIGSEFAHTRAHPDGSFDILFNWHWHAGDSRAHYLNALRTAHREGRIPDPTPAGIAELRFGVLGTTAHTPSEYVDRINDAQSTAEVEGLLREALVAVTGAPVDVELQEPDSSHVTSIDSAKDVARGLIESAAEYPGTPLTSVRVAEIRDETDNTVDMKVYAEADGWKNRPADLVFNAPWHSEGRREEYVKSLRADADSKFTVGVTPHGVAAHEMGHAVSRYNDGWADRSDLPGHDGTLREEVEDKAGGPYSEWDDLAGSVSRYARKNDEELTAESVGDVHRNRDKAAKVSAVVVARLRDANRQRVPPLEPLRRDGGVRPLRPRRKDADAAAAASPAADNPDQALRGLGSVDTMNRRPRPDNVRQAGSAAPGANGPPSLEPSARTGATATPRQRTADAEPDRS